MNLEITTTNGPTGELVIQTLAMPADANAYGDVFGGWLVSQMDIGGSVLAHKRAGVRVTTVAINKMFFLKPVNIGDCICCYASVERTGRSSIDIAISVWGVRRIDWERQKVAEGIFTFVAIDANGKPQSIDWESTAHLSKS